VVPFGNRGGRTWCRGTAIPLPQDPTACLRPAALRRSRFLLARKVNRVRCTDDAACATGRIG